MHNHKTFGLLSVLTLAACSSTGSLDFTQLVSIQPGDGAGNSLSGTFGVIANVTSNNCLSTDLNTPAQGTKLSVDATLVQSDGTLTMEGLDVAVRGAYNFDGTFELGGADIVDRGGSTGNILRLMKIQGKFSDANNFTGSVEEQLTGQINLQKIDCSLTYDISDGVKK